LRFGDRVWTVLATGAGFLALSAVPGQSSAQSAPVVSRPVVQPLPSGDSQRLTSALARLGRDPRDVSALIDAGDAASAMGDFDAAVGFYRRADAISANNPKVKAGLAKAYVASGDPVTALSLFAEAERAGAQPADIASARGLAYDLVGDSSSAQRYYAMALGGADDSEVRQRLAISQAIAGNEAASETTLMPLLRKQDKPAWRTRAFALAIAGKTREAVGITNTMLPPNLADSIAPYLRYMPRLTKSQQAAAANLGEFPRASEIGQDDPKIAAWIASHPAQLASADAGLIPKGDALGAGGKSARKGRAERRSGKIATSASGTPAASRSTKLAEAETTRVAPPEPRPSIETGDSGELPPVNAAAPAPAPAQSQSQSRPPVTTPRPSVALPTARPEPVRTPPSVTPRASSSTASSRTPAPGFDLAKLENSQAASPPASPPDTRPAASQGTSRTVVEAPSPSPQPAPEPAPAPVSLAQIFADLGKPTMQAAPAAGAVDLTKIQPARPEPKPEPEAEPQPSKAQLKAEEAKAAKAKAARKPPPPSHPSRIWVQIGVGRDKGAIAYDWRRLSRQSPAVFKGQKPSTTEMGRTNRILAGPFETQKAASEWLAQVTKAGVDGAFIWTSPAGQVVDPLQEK